MARFSLTPHPRHPPRTVKAVTVQVQRTDGGRLWIEYGVKESADLVLPPEQSSGRADGLWKTTCFELFFKPNGGEAYREFNFSPSSRWAAYGFDRYRSDWKNMTIDDPEIEISSHANPWFFLAAEIGSFDVGGSLGLSAVIEETGGAKSYWALAHPPEGPPDFHHPACFAATLPAPRDS